MIAERNLLTLSLSNINIKDRAVTDNGSPMKIEFNRRLSFKNWPLAYISPTALAKAGFYYMQVQDQVRCAFCEREIGHWDDGDDPIVVHKMHNSLCPLINGLDCGNIRMDQQLESDSSANPRGEDTCGKYGIQYYPRAKTAETSLTKLGINAIVSPKYPAYATIGERTRSFIRWPMALKQKPAEMAEAGFFYTGEGDLTFCFSCGNRLSSWQPDDIPFEQHAMWYPNCTYLRHTKSAEFISSMAERAKATSTTEGEASQSIPNTSSESTKTKDIVEEKPTKETTDQPKLCKICLTNEISVAFMPCGHLVACRDCAATITKCAICRTTLTATLKTFFT